MADTKNRRPLASRDTRWATRITRWLASTPITPNQISMAGIGAAFLAGGCFWLAGGTHGFGRAILLVLAAAFTQTRLLCNLFDGMVAIEAGRASPDGGFWNEFPDRVADLLILIGVGLGLGLPALGWAAVSFAFLTAYVRQLGVSCGTAADFSGPMAKQHRMAVVTAAALISIAEPVWSGHGGVLHIALWIVAVGAAVTALRRAVRLVQSLKRSATAAP
ncbi:CDP-alcohol phosphatidyltransferase family protein [Paracoccus aestuariivivens]|uniref:CDP-alcohol phosphatidyltransferase family protein n=1 Tax=Paracoccus aestuariivivens TaxID=1820333 RepID=A0A6L6JG16_9RHOB|nr:CDP-alcohol phosphatidyltransferase family protein [Paracoccus aestuariivivens]MTH79054.1 CDP-alcohol phosphatidyltransferase family protein [Paracoccus aestuariivivens]